MYPNPQPLFIPADTRIPALEVDAVERALTQQKRTSSGQNELPYWIWRDFSYLLAPTIKKLFNCSLQQQMVHSSWKLRM